MVQLQLAYDRLEEIKKLFSEYTQMLMGMDQDFADYLKLQRYDVELEHLQEKYGMPEGRLYLLTVDGHAAGCVGLRRINREQCEMKRLYVRPLYRGQKLADRLLLQIIADAKEEGYTSMVLDTLPFLESAIRLYRRHGFHETTSYNDSPMQNSIFMKLAL